MPDTAETSVVVELQAQIQKFVQAVSVDAPAALKAGVDKITGMSNALEDVGKNAGASFLKGFQGAMSNGGGTSKIAKDLGTGDTRDFQQAGEAAGSSYTKGFQLVTAALASWFLVELKNNIGKVTEYASQLGTLSIETGDSTTHLQELQYAFEGVGVSAQNAQVQFAQFQRRISEAASSGNANNIFARMGLDPKKMQNQDLTENLFQVSDKIKGLSSASQKTDVASQLFGRAGSQMLPILDQGSAGIKKGMAQGAGSTISPADIQKLQQLDGMMKQLSQTSLAFFASFIAPMADGMMKVISAIEQVENGFKQLNDAMKNNVIFGALALALHDAGSGLEMMHGLLVNLIGREVLMGLSQFVAGLDIVIDVATAIYVAYQTNFAGMRDVIITVVNAVISVFEALYAAGVKVAAAAKEQLGPAIDKLSASLKPFTAAIALTIEALLKAAIVIIENTVQAVILLITMLANVITIAANVINAVTALGQVLSVMVVEAFADATHAAADFFTVLANIADKVPVIGSTIASGMRTIADEAERMAKALDKSAAFGKTHKIDLSLGLDTKFKNPFAGMKFTKPPSGNGGDGSESLAPETKKSGTDAAKSNIDALKASFDAYNDKVADSEVHMQALQTRMEELGAIDTPGKMQAQQALYNGEIATSISETQEHQALLEKQISVAHELKADQKAATDPKVAKEYGAAWKEVHDQIHKSQLQILEDESKTAKLRLAAMQAQAEAAKSMADAAIATDTSAANQKKAEVERSTKIRATQVAPAHETSEEQHTLAEQNAEDALIQAKIEEALATQVVIQRQQELADTNSKDVVAYKQASDALQAAKLAEYNATTAATVALNQYTNAQNATLKSVTDTRDAFNKLIDSALGPFSATIQLIQEGVNPLAAIFITLFEKSKSFNDILTVLTDVANALAQVFDALRPVIDFFLGVLVGIVDVFLGLYNVIAQVLNMFGLHIQKIQMLNSVLDQTIAAVPLLQVTHDLPTANEYNAGVWGDLLAKQDAANQTANSTEGILDQGFSSSLSKLGEIVGALLAMKAILMIIEAQGVLKNAFGGVSSQGGGIMQLIKGFLGGSSSGGSTDIFSEVENAYGSSGGGSGDVSAFTDAVSDGTSDAIMSSGLDTSLQAVADATTQNTDMLDQAKTAIGSGSGSTALTGTLQTTAKIFQGIGDAAGIVNGFQQGGIMGGAEAGLSADSLALLIGATGGVATPIAIGVGLLAALFGGNHDVPANMPDKYDTTNFTTDVGELQGSAATAYGPAYDPSTDPVQQALGGQDMLSYIQTWISNNLNSTDAATAAEAQSLLGQYGDASTGATGKLSFGTDIGDEAVIGGSLSGTYTSLAQAAGQAITAIQGLTQASQSLATLLNSSTNVDLATLFGNSSVVTADGGYSVTPGGAQVPASAGAGAATAPAITVNIDTINGLDADVATTTLTDALTEAYTQAQISLRTRQFTTGVATQ